MYDNIYEYEDSYVDMASAEMFFTIAYLLIAACLAVPPTEFVSAGFTIQNLLSNYLGSEDIDFIEYHIRRTVSTLIFHSCLPLGYIVGFCVTVALPPFASSLLWQCGLAVSLLLPLLTLSLASYWSRRRWARHPLARQLAVHDADWRTVASQINTEVRRVDKFTSGPSGRRLVVTDSWLLKTSAYSVDVAHQADIHLTLVESEQHALNHEGSTGGGAQFLNIEIRGIAGRVKPFSIRLNALEYNDLKNKLRGPIRNVRNIVIHQSLSERFLEAFRQLVSQNPVCAIPADLDLEACIGCMQQPAGVCVRRMCGPDTACQPCACRPMWCVDCMGRWFASRQNQAEPGAWLAGRAPCPTCRATFCMLDICIVF